MIQPHPTPKPVSRRKFLKSAVLAAGGAGLACCSLAYAAAQFMPQSAPAPVETPSISYAEEPNMNPKILVTYATRTGSTVGVASAIGETLASRGFSVDVKPLNERPSLEGYQAVVIGSAVNGYKWLPEAVEYVEARQDALKKLPVALFCVHALNTGSKASSKKNRESYLKDIRPLVNPLCEGYFAGMCGKPGETGGIAMWFARTFMDATPGDGRDWGKIRGWANALAF
jgi:menaquinone-dependent protoporphyrinogen oxidase